MNTWEAGREEELRLLTFGTLWILQGAISDDHNLLYLCFLLVPIWLHDFQTYDLGRCPT